MPYTGVAKITDYSFNIVVVVGYFLSHDDKVEFVFNPLPLQNTATGLHGSCVHWH